MDILLRLLSLSYCLRILLRVMQLNIGWVKLKGGWQSFFDLPSIAGHEAIEYIGIPWTATERYFFRMGEHVT